MIIKKKGLQRDLIEDKSMSVSIRKFASLKLL